MRFSAILTYLISLDRHLHMHPNVLTTSKWRERLKKCFKRPQIYFVLLFSAMMAVLFSWYIYNVLYLDEEVQGVLLLNETILALLVCSIISGLYFKGYFGIQKHVAQSRVYSNETSGDSSHRGRYLQNLSKTVLLLVLALLSTHVPFYIANGIIAVTQLVKGFLVSKGLILFYTLGCTLLCSNGIFNSMIVMYRNKEAKQWVFRKLLRCGSRKRRDEVQVEGRAPHSTGENEEAK